MTVPFIVEPDAFQQTEAERAAWIASHERLLQTWGKFGVLVLPPDSGLTAEIVGLR
jgi:hypothetical protein